MDCAALLPFVGALLGFAGVCLRISLEKSVTINDLISYVERVCMYIFFFSFTLSSQNANKQ